MTQLIRAGKQLLDTSLGVQYTSAGKVVLDSSGAVKFLRVGKLLFDTNGFLQYIKNGKLYVGKDTLLTAYSADSTGKITTSFEDARTSDLYVPDHEGVLHAIPGGTVAFEGARVVHNYVDDPNDFSSSRWIKSNVTVDGNELTATANGDMIRQITTKAALGGEKGVVRIELKAGTSNKCRITILGSSAGLGLVNKDVTLTSDYKVYSVATTMPSDGDKFRIRIYPAYADGVGAGSVFARNPQLESKTGNSNPAIPSEYTSDIAFYNTQNGNTVDANGVVTEAVGAPITTPIRMVHAPATTNSCESYNVAPVDLTGITTFAGAPSIVDDSANIPTALAAIANGNVLKLPVGAKVGFPGVPDAASGAAVVFSAYAKGGDFTIYIGGSGNPTVVTGTASYTKIEHATTTVATNQYFTVKATGTSDVYLIGWQSEAGSQATPIIPTHGETGGASRDICQIRAPYAGAFNQAEGVAYMEWEPGVSASVDSALLAMTTATGLLTATSTGIKSDDGTNVASLTATFSAGTRYHVAMRWKTGGTFRVGYRTRGASSWTWGSAVSYDGNFPSDDLFIRLFYNNPYNNNLHNLEILNKDIGLAAIEDRYSLAKVG